MTSFLIWVGIPLALIGTFLNWKKLNELAGKVEEAERGARFNKSMIEEVERSAKSQLSLVRGFVAKVAAGVVSEIESCSGEWCEISASGYGGWIEQSMLWGVYPGEVVD